MLYPAYSVQALRWQPLSSSIRSLTTPTVQPGSLRTAQENLQKALDEQRWLLDENQHLTVPPTHLDDYQGRIFSIGDFVKRADEARDADVHRTAVDEHGRRRMLTKEQFEHLKETGELDVPSELFENQYHTWRVASGFYSGTNNVRQSFGEGFGKALDHWVAYTGDSVMLEEGDKRRPTLRKAMKDGLGQTFKLLRGAAGQLFAGRLRHRTYSDDRIEYLLDEAERGYVLHHLREHDTRCLLDQYRYEHRYHLDTSSEHEDKVWDALAEDAQFERKFRPSSQQCLATQEARRALESVRESFEEYMQPKRNVRLDLDEEMSSKSPQAALEEAKRAESQWRASKDQAWIDHLKSQTDPYLKTLGRIEADRLEAKQIEQDVEREDANQVEEHLQNYEDSLKKKRPILSLSNAWRKRKVDKERTKIVSSLEATRLDRVAQRLNEGSLEVQCAARALVTEFRRDHREALAKRLRSKLSSFPPATFKVLQLDPNNWTFHGGNALNRYKTVEVDLGKPFWRVQYSWMVFVTLSKSLIGGAFHFLTSGPLSLRAFFSPRPYYAVNRPVRDPGSFTQTLVSRLSSFYEALKSVRQRFDASPDTGLIGKSIQSFFLQIYLALKGTVGTVCIVVFMTVGTLLSTALNLAVLTLAPVIAATCTVLLSLFNLVVYDTVVARARHRCSGSDSNMPSCVSPVIKIGLSAPYFLLVPGALQAGLAAICLAVVHPIAGIAFLSWASVRFTLRSLRDSFTWFFIRKYSRIPASNTFLAWRIHGPGVASTEYYRLPVEAAKTSVLLSLDSFRLHAHEVVRRCELDAPYTCYAKLFKQLVMPFGVGISMGVSPPSLVAMQISSEVRHGRPKWFNRRRELQEFSSVTSEHSLDIWSEVAQAIRSSHPAFDPAQEASKIRRWDVAAGPSTSLAMADETCRTEVDAAVRKLNFLSDTTELDEMVTRCGKALAEFTINMDQRERRIVQAVSVPPFAAGRFRMSEAEQNDLWNFTQKAVEVYGLQIQEELDEVLETSEFSSELKDTVDRVKDSFYTDSGARPGRDIPVVAAFLLRKLLGGDDMLITLEQTDETLVLSPKISEEDEHLVFWRSLDLP